MKESTVQNNIRKALRKEYAPYYWDFKVHGSHQQKVGVPDLCCVINGRSVFVEVKQPGKTPTGGQFGVMREIQLAGGIAVWADSVESALYKVKEALLNGKKIQTLQTSKKSIKEVKKRR